MLEELNPVLERGGEIGGTSARATIQDSFLAPGDRFNHAIREGVRANRVVQLTDRFFEKE